MTREQRIIEAIAWAMLAIGLWSIVGAVASIILDDPASAWRFLWSAFGSAATMFMIGIYQGRTHD